MTQTVTGAVWLVTVTREDDSQYRSILKEGTLDEIHAFVTALVSPTSHFRIEEVVGDVAASGIMQESVAAIRAAECDYADAEARYDHADAWR